MRDGTQREAQGASQGASAERAVLSAERLVGELDVLPPGTQLVEGRFEIVCRLGQGGIGVVYEALDHERGERVALKTLSHVEPGAIYRLKHEFRARCPLGVKEAPVSRLGRALAVGRQRRSATSCYHRRFTAAVGYVARRASRPA